MKAQTEATWLEFVGLVSPPSYYEMWKVAHTKSYWEMTSHYHDC